MSPGKYMSYSPIPSPSPQSPHIAGHRSSAFSDQEKYITELLAERQKLSPFQSVLPLCGRLLNQEILRVTALLGNAQILVQTGLEHARPLASGGLYSNGRPDVNGWTSPYHSEACDYNSQFSALLPYPWPQSWLGSYGNSSGPVVKRTIRIDIPVYKYPNYNFVGRLLDPRGDSLKRVEASTGCRVLVRGRGSIKDPAREEMLRGTLGYEHLNEPLHILVEAELPVEIVEARLIQARDIMEDLLQPVEERQDFFKRQQLRELAIHNGTLCEDVSDMSDSVSPFHNNSLGMKRAKTQG